MSRAFNDKTDNVYVIYICMVASNNIFSYWFNTFILNAIFTVMHSGSDMWIAGLVSDDNVINVTVFLMWKKTELETPLLHHHWSVLRAHFGLSSSVNEWSLLLANGGQLGAQGLFTMKFKQSLGAQVASHWPKGVITHSQNCSSQRLGKVTSELSTEIRRDATVVYLP